MVRISCLHSPFSTLPILFDPTSLIVRHVFFPPLAFTGAVSLEYHLSQQPLFGNWTIKVVAQGQEETKDFLVEEYCEL